jgi:hypothetical protein
MSSKSAALGNLQVTWKLAQFGESKVSGKRPIPEIHDFVLNELRSQTIMRGLSSKMLPVKAKTSAGQ